MLACHLVDDCGGAFPIGSVRRKRPRRMWLIATSHLRIYPSARTAVEARRAQAHEVDAGEHYRNLGGMRHGTAYPMNLDRRAPDER